MDKTLPMTSIAVQRALPATRPGAWLASRWERRSVLVRPALISTALLFFTVFLLLPLGLVFVEALKYGLSAYFAALVQPEAVAALRLSLFVLVVVVSVNTVFGVGAAWVLSKFQFPGRTLLMTLIDLPFAVSPVIAGLVFVLLFGRQGWWGPWLADHGVTIIYATPGIILASLFVTCPYITRQLLPLMTSQGLASEEASLLLGASGWQTFWHVTLPAIRWPLAHGVVLCAARTLGEFGAVSVVSGHINGLTNTLPLQVESLYNEYRMGAAFALASLLALLSLATLALKQLALARSPAVLGDPR